MRCKIVLISLVFKHMGIINIIMEADNVCNLKSYPPSSHWISNVPGFYLISRIFEESVGKKFKRNGNHVRVCGLNVSFK